MFQPTVQLQSGGYIVINQTEALVAIDVNSGRATREHHIEDTALKTNMEAAEEISRQLRLRDLAGLIVIDFIDMDEKRNNRSVERRLKECLKNDRARIQVGRISHFGLLEMSRQRIRSSVLESSTDKCPHCGGTGNVRSVASVSLQLLRTVEDALLKGATHNLVVRTRSEVALYVLNNKRAHLRDLEDRFRITITVYADATMGGQQPFVVEKGEQVHTVEQAKAIAQLPANIVAPMEPEEDIVEDVEAEEEVETEGDEIAAEDAILGDGERAGTNETAETTEGGRRRKRRRRRGRRDGGEPLSPGATPTHETVAEHAVAHEDHEDGDDEGDEEGEQGQPDRGPAMQRSAGEDNGNGERRRRRRGRRGGRRNRRTEGEPSAPEGTFSPIDEDVAHAAADFGGPLIADEPRQPEPPRFEPQRFESDRPEHADIPPVQAEPREPPQPAAQDAAPPPPPAPEAPRRRSTVREPVSVYVEGSELTYTPPPALPAPPAEPPAAEPQPVEQPDQPRRSGWWSRK